MHFRSSFSVHVVEFIDRSGEKNRLQHFEYSRNSVKFPLLARDSHGAKIQGLKFDADVYL